VAQCTRRVCAFWHFVIGRVLADTRDWMLVAKPDIRFERCFSAISCASIGCTEPVARHAVWGWARRYWHMPWNLRKLKIACGLRC
jgi:hypothetical protein